MMDGTVGSNIHITKLAAARRQLREAIHMYFAGADELAIHTVASAAYSVISDLKSKRGRNEVGDQYLNMVFYAVRDYCRGTLPSYLADDPEAMRWIRELVDQFPITASSKYNDFKVSVSTNAGKEFWKERNFVSNFLKHADRDSGSHISMENVDNLFLLRQAHGSYIDLVRGDLLYEGWILWVYHAVDSGMTDGLPIELLKIVTDLELLSCDERLKFCSKFLNKLNGERRFE